MAGPYVLALLKPDEATFDPADGFPADATLTSQGGRCSTPSLPADLRLQPLLRVLVFLLECLGFARLVGRDAGVWVLVDGVEDPFVAGLGLVPFISSTAPSAPPR